MTETEPPASGPVSERSPLVEVNFDGIVGPTHGFTALSRGSGELLSDSHGKPCEFASSGAPTSNPRAAAHEGLAKMLAVHRLGVLQAVLPPQQRPCLSTLHRLGFFGSPEQSLAAAAAADPRVLRLVSSASPMWAANAVTVAPSCDTSDGRVHFVPANLRSTFHRSLETETTRCVLRAIFRDRWRFAIHDELPGGDDFADEGAANHTRLTTPSGGVAHLFAWGRRAFGEARSASDVPKRRPARQTREASEAVGRLLHLPEDMKFFAQQHPLAVDAGADHTDVVAVGHDHFFMAHEYAFSDGPALQEELTRRLGDELVTVWATQQELPIEDALQSQVFNSQVVTLGGESGGSESPGPRPMALIAPRETRENPRARAFVDRVLALGGPVKEVHYVEVRASMRDGGGPACLRQRIPLKRSEMSQMSARVLFDVPLHDELVRWVDKHYRERLTLEDLADPGLWRQSMAALDELTRILKLGPVYEFQQEG